MRTYKLTPEAQQKEKYTLQQILFNEKYGVSTFSKFSKEKKKQKPDTQKKKGQNSRMLGERRGSSLNSSKNQCQGRMHYR